MAISATNYYITRDLRANNLLPQHGALLEIGEANWYGDVNPLDLLQDVDKFVVDPARRSALAERLRATVGDGKSVNKFDVAKIYYEIFYAPVEMQAIDLHGTEHAQPLDLNGPISLSRQFHVVINNGTAEHVFNIGQLLRTIHEVTLPGGMMIHESPFTGWIDHGFYSLQPTLFFDLAAANGYLILGMLIQDMTGFAITQLPTRESVYELAQSGQIADNTMLMTVLVKGNVEAPFQIPMQGYYGSKLSAAGEQAWRVMR
jgi:hypothetical protein